MAFLNFIKHLRAREKNNCFGSVWRKLLIAANVAPPLPLPCSKGAQKVEVKKHEREITLPCKLMKN
jgi:hypothetical protein